VRRQPSAHRRQAGRDRQRLFKIVQQGKGGDEPLERAVRESVKHGLMPSRALLIMPQVRGRVAVLRSRVR